MCVVCGVFCCTRYFPASFEVVHRFIVQRSGLSKLPLHTIRCSCVYKSLGDSVMCCVYFVIVAAQVCIPLCCCT